MKATAEEIKEAIVSLSETEYNNLRNWFGERDWKLWDSQIEKDGKAGNLDFLLREALMNR